MGYREKYSRSHEREDNRPDTRGKTENFFSRNVRLITFLICVSVFLAFFVPIVAYEVVDYLADARDNRPEMTMSDVLRLSEQNGKGKFFYTSASSLLHKTGISSGYRHYESDILQHFFNIIRIVLHVIHIFLYRPSEFRLQARDWN